MRTGRYSLTPYPQELKIDDMRRLFSLCALVALVMAASPARALEKTMITSATYGVLAGTIVGAATLAFAENPGDNLHRIARGASLGLYAGILLGFYVTYGIGGGGDDEEYDESLVKAVKINKPPRFAIVPVFGNRGIEGATALWNVSQF